MPPMTSFLPSAEGSLAPESGVGSVVAGASVPVGASVGSVVPLVHPANAARTIMRANASAKIFFIGTVLLQKNF